MDRRHFLQTSGGCLAALLAGCDGGGSSSAPPPAPPAGSGLVSGGTDFGPLASRLQGAAMAPTTTGDDNVRLLANTLYDDIRPQAIVRCVSAADVQAVLAFVQDKGLHVTARCGGHSWAGYSTTTGVVLNVNAMNSVTVNGDGSATVGAGARLAEVYTGLIARGVRIPSGSCPTVGIAGITMGGGIDVLDRRFGLTCDTLASADVVTVDGRLLTCSAASEADLFRALRGGGGGNFGIATSFTYRTHPTQDITVARASFALQDFAAVFKTWQAWPSTVPDSIWAQIYVNIWQGVATFTATAWSTGGAYVNYLDPLLVDWQTACHGANYARLQQVKKTCDPNRVPSVPQGTVAAP